MVYELFNFTFDFFLYFFPIFQKYFREIRRIEKPFITQIYKDINPSNFTKISLNYCNEMKEEIKRGIVQLINQGAKVFLFFTVIIRLKN